MEWTTESSQNRTHTEHDTSCDIANSGGSLLDVGSDHPVDIIGDVPGHEVDSCHFLGFNHFRARADYSRMLIELN